MDHPSVHNRPRIAGNVRIALAGLGHRGMATLHRYRLVEGASIVAMSDTDPAALAEATRWQRDNGVTHSQTFDSWESMVAQADADLFYICTPRHTHADMVCIALEAGRDVAVEVPAATTVADCRRVAETVVRSGRFFTMLENCCYDPFALFTQQLVEDGMLGELTHCEGAYIHDLRERPDFVADMRREGTGNPYPTHGLGPICRLLDIGRSDRLSLLTSMGCGASPEAMINNTLIRTRLGRTILMQFDVTTPRPYSRLQTVCGTRGYVSKYPVPMVQLDGGPLITGADLDRLMEQHLHPLLARYRDDAARLNVDNLMNYIMDRHLIDTYRNGEQPDITASDAALWSSIAELSAQSAADMGAPRSIPEF